MADSRTRELIDQDYLSEDDALMYYASKYPELTEYVNNYAYALENLTDTERDEAEALLKQNIAMQDAIANYKTLTGQKISTADVEMAKEKIRKELEAEVIGTADDGTVITAAM
jgi:hypothetical protein